MDQDILLKAKTLASQGYTINILVDRLSDGSTVFMAKDAELFGCMAQGVTPEEAIRNLYDARVDYIYDSIVNCEPINEPKFTPKNELQAQYIRIDLTPIMQTLSKSNEDLDIDVSKYGERILADPSTSLTVSKMTAFANA